MNKLITYQIDSFTKEKFKGNPAGVVINADGLNEKQMQLIARELNNSETAFLFPPDRSDCDGVIRYFTPKTEVPTCGHATVAAMYAKALEENLNSCVMRMKTKIGILPFEIIKELSNYQVIMTQGEVEINDPLDEQIKSEVIKALGLNDEDLDSRCPVQIVSTGNSKVIIGIKTKDKLNNMMPNLNSLSELSKKIKSTGYFIFTFDTNEKDILTTGRMFAPAIGINEDPVTGNANGPLGAYLVTNKLVNCDTDSFVFNGKQGEAIGRPGIVKVIVKIEDGKPVLVQIKGEAVVIFKTQILI
jgi:PhzF family phenazine biosynthesis protein